MKVKKRREEKGENATDASTSSALPQISEANVGVKRGAGKGAEPGEEVLRLLGKFEVGAAIDFHFLSFYLYVYVCACVCVPYDLFAGQG